MGKLHPSSRWRWQWCAVGAALAAGVATPTGCGTSDYLHLDVRGPFPTTENREFVLEFSRASGNGRGSVRLVAEGGQISVSSAERLTERCVAMPEGQDFYQEKGKLLLEAESVFLYATLFDKTDCTGDPILTLVEAVSRTGDTATGAGAGGQGGTGAGTQSGGGGAGGANDGGSGGAAGGQGGTSAAGGGA